MSNIETLTEHTVTDVVEPGILVIDHWASWCGPCGAMAPQFERASELRPQYRFATVNIDDQPTVASAFQVRSIPTQFTGLLDQLAATREPKTVLQEGAAR